ncbi:hypothetical protein AB0M28_20955 [Streptomyces sp. NPDC051940]|uniref:hypothetical protein n=1 Tax=Streptomyces sp. NPDC051940 TaxID=3155675 RepID=UPI00343CD92E
MRPAHESDERTSPTPIYDELCAEYRRLFRALPGDRTGEERLRFDAVTGYGYGRRGRHSGPDRELGF